MDQLTADQTEVMTQVNSTVSYVSEAKSHVTGPKPNPNLCHVSLGLIDPLTVDLPSLNLN